MAEELLGEAAGEPVCELWPARDASSDGAHCTWAGATQLPGAHTSTNCFHVLGLDIMFDQAGKGWLLEVNCSPSLAIDSVYPTTGPAAEEPTPCPEGAPHEALMAAALEVMGRKATKVCRCMSHHRPHLHYPCAVDLVAKVAAVEGALTMVRRETKARKEGREVPHDEELCEGTASEPCARD